MAHNRAPIPQTHVALCQKRTFRKANRHVRFTPLIVRSSSRGSVDIQRDHFPCEIDFGKNKKLEQLLWFLLQTKRAVSASARVANTF